MKKAKRAFGLRFFCGVGGVGERWNRLKAGMVELTAARLKTASPIFLGSGESKHPIEDCKSDFTWFRGIKAPD